VLRDGAKSGDGAFLHCLIWSISPFRKVSSFEIVPAPMLVAVRPDELRSGKFPRVSFNPVILRIQNIMRQSGRVLLYQHQGSSEYGFLAVSGPEYGYNPEYVAEYSSMIVH